MKTKWNVLLAVVIGGAFMAAAGTADAMDLQAWDTQINNPGRFKVLNDFGGAAVLDKETQLVWERSPDMGGRTWHNALAHCYQREVGVGGGRVGSSTRMGWRLPSIEELASLVDRAQSNPALPSGHPFNNVVSHFYWSSTTNAGNSADAWIVHFGSGGVGPDIKPHGNGSWCVRGGQGIDGVQ